MKHILIFVMFLLCSLNIRAQIVPEQMPGFPITSSYYTCCGSGAFNYWANGIINDVIAIKLNKAVFYSFKIQGNSSDVSKYALAQVGFPVGMSINTTTVVGYVGGRGVERGSVVAYPGMCNVQYKMTDTNPTEVSVIMIFQTN